MADLAEAAEGRLRRALGLPSLVLFGLVYMVPLTVFTTYGIVTQTTGGRLSVAYLVTLAAMVFTARSYARMAVAYPVAGLHIPTPRGHSVRRSDSSPAGHCCWITCSCR